MTTTSINMVDARRMVIDCYEADEPLMLIGKPGMGKTSMFESVCQEKELGFIDFRLTLRDPTEVGGMRVPDTKTGRLRHYIPDDLPDPTRHGMKGIMLFDEINVVSQLLQATAYGLIQERRNGSYRMAKGWVPMASGNNVSDRAAAQRLSAALANRFNVQIVEPHLDSWLQQYGSEHVDMRGTAFLRFRPMLFHVMPGEMICLPGETPEQAAKKANAPKADDISFPSARSWTKAFKFIDKEPSYRRKIYNGYVGALAADEFEAYWRIMERATTLDAILADPKTAKLPAPDDAGTCYAMSGMIARAMNRKNMDRLMIYTERMEADYQVAIVIDATRQDPGLKNTAAYGAWAVKHQDVLL